MTGSGRSRLSEIVAIVGSRWGHDEAHLSYFLHDLHLKHPDTIVISGGADGADRQAEDTWRMLGGEVWSFRPVKLERGFGWGVERLIWKPAVMGVVPDQGIRRHPTWANEQSARWYRSIVVADLCHRLVAFFRAGRSNGTQFTVDLVQYQRKPAYVYEREAPHVAVA